MKKAYIWYCIIWIISTGIGLAFMLIFKDYSKNDLGEDNINLLLINLMIIQGGLLIITTGCFIASRIRKFAVVNGVIIYSYIVIILIPVLTMIARVTPGTATAFITYMLGLFLMAYLIFAENPSNYYPED